MQSSRFEQAENRDKKFVARKTETNTMHAHSPQNLLAGQKTLITRGNKVKRRIRQSVRYLLYSELSTAYKRQVIRGKDKYFSHKSILGQKWLKFKELVIGLVCWFLTPIDIYFRYDILVGD